MLKPLATQWLQCITLYLGTVLFFYWIGIVSRNISASGRGPVDQTQDALGSTQNASVLTSDPLVTCLAAAQVEFLVKGAANWTQETQGYNLRVMYEPAAVAIPTSIDQIQAAVLCGIDNDVRVTAKGGGHSFGSYGIGGEDGHLVITLDRMYGVSVHDDGTARIQPGVRTAVADRFRSVGIGGLVLHGGYGLATRTHGLTLDWLIGATVILANGTMVHCSSADNEDLFWALRGAGSSFGIVAEFEFDTFEVPEQITSFTMVLNWLESEAVNGLGMLQDLITEAPKELNMLIEMTPSAQSIQGTYYGDEDGLKGVLQPLLKHVKTQETQAGELRMATVGWIEALEKFGYGPLDMTYPLKQHANMYATNLVVYALTQGQLEALMSIFYKTENATSRPTWTMLFELVGGTHSALTGIDSSATSFFHHDKMMLVQLSGLSPRENTEEGIGLLEGFKKTFTDMLGDGNWGMYANYVDTELDSAAAQRLYWGGNLERLQQIKAQLDPGEVFWNPQGIRPASHVE
ncbi:hypothetical protein G7Z17_g9328 [Cylindrodendrum hubeiense]|uniref:FAD-binding PCMH-type domain-containing protein n=1 Tax=Cylindrodendrum hubeiense TaxID=595255 RepID=A0A9P5H456_9HYPO|nr:hypothetical protein G7Z17_g9328 [Cylindrodendrum hubeiense]